MQRQAGAIGLGPTLLFAALGLIGLFMPRHVGAHDARLEWPPLFVKGFGPMEGQRARVGPMGGNYLSGESVLERGS